MRRLYQKIYLTIVASLVLVVIVAGAIWRLGCREHAGGAGVRDGGRTASPCCCRRPMRRARVQQTGGRAHRDAAAAPTSRSSTPRDSWSPSTGDAVAAAARATVGGWVYGAEAAGVEPATARRALVRRARVAAPPCAVGRASAHAGQHRARGRGRRLSGGARADAAAGASADWRRDARRRQPGDARQGRGRDEVARLADALQPFRRAHRGAGERAPHAARACVARAAHAAVAAAARASSCTPRPAR